MPCAERNCVCCNKPIKGRADKRFCNDICRTAFHNRRNGKTNSFVRRVDLQLHRNRRILCELLESASHRRIAARAMEQQGFVFGYVTQLVRGSDGRRYFFCYEYCYVRLARGEVLVVRNCVVNDQ